MHQYYVRNLGIFLGIFGKCADIMYVCVRVCGWVGCISLSEQANKDHKSFGMTCLSQYEVYQTTSFYTTDT